MTSNSIASGCLKRILKGIGFLLLGLLLVLAILVIFQRVALARTRAQMPAPGAIFLVNDRAMHLNCQGSGSPTVVIDAGNGSFSLEWTPIQAEVSRSVRVCTFDRPGYGWSAPGPDPRDGEQVAAELYALLQAAGEAGPYVLVGHSLGGIHVRIFAARHPEDVAGLVLAETRYPLTLSPDLVQQIPASVGFYRVMGLLTQSGVLRILSPLGGDAMLPETASKLPAGPQADYLQLLLDPNQYTTAAAEMLQLPQTLDQAAALTPGDRPWGDLPLIVLTAGLRAAPGSTPFDTAQIPVDEEWIQAGRALADQSTRGEQRLLPESGHLVHLDAPGAVIRAILDVVADGP